jgi:hypothetical protein
MTEDLLHLLASAVDGELIPAEQSHVHRLLCESEDARSVFARLQSDSIRLRSLRKAPPADLVQRIMAKLPQAEPVQPRVRSNHSRRWVAAGLAASVLLALGVFNALKSPKSTQEPAASSFAHAPPTNITEVLPKESGSPALPPVPPEPSMSNSVAEVVPEPKKPDPIDEIPAPRLKGVDVLVAPPLRPIPPLDRFVVRVPLLVSVADLAREDHRQRLLDDLGRDSAYRIDLFTKDAARGAELFQAAAKASGISLSIDALAADRLKKKQATAYAVYVESLTAVEARDLLSRLAADDAKNPQPVFDLLHASPAHTADQTALKELLGIDPGLWRRPASGNTEPKPISADTGDQIAKSLTGKPAEKPAILLTFTPAAARTNPAVSKELKEFLARRGDRKASAVPLLIVIRQP